jgi:tetratricopeptide (TPR) repeat protein
LEMDPKNPVHRFDLAVFYAGAKDYSSAWQYADQAIAIHPMASAILLKAWLCAAWKDDLNEMKTQLGTLRLHDRNIDEAVHLEMWCGLLRRNPEEVMQSAKRITKRYIEHRYVWSGPVDWHSALASHMQGKDEVAEHYWKASRAEIERRLKEDTCSGLHPHLRVQLATTLAWMGELEEARRQVRLVEAEWKGRELTAARSRELAGYYAATGDAAKAIPLLEHALAADSGPGGLTLNLLRLDPWWDKLREHTDFQRRFPRESERDVNCECPSLRLRRTKRRGPLGLRNRQGHRSKNG